MRDRRRRRIGCWLVLALLAAAALLGWRELKRLEREHPERLPWTDLNLANPIGPFTRMKLAALADDSRKCGALLVAARLGDRPAPPLIGPQPQCGYRDGIAVLPDPQSRQPILYSPAGLVTSCPVAAALALWEKHVLQPAALLHFGQRVTRIVHAGSFSCRRLYGRSEGPFSEHATADAVDVTGFALADGRTISVLRDWQGDESEQAFLRDVRDGACELFATVLSPDYNRAHADHFHFDQAERGARGWSICR